jgi:hypothetical protein
VPGFSASPSSRLFSYRPVSRVAQSIAEALKQRLGDFMAEGGGWKGESEEEILRFLREARDAGGTTELQRGPRSGSSKRT